MRSVRASVALMGWIGLQALTASAQPVGPEIVVNTNTAINHVDLAIASGTDGGFIVAWATWDSDTFARLYASNGSPVGGEFLLNEITTGDQTLPAVAALPGGDWLVAWSSSSQDGSGDNVFGRFFDPLGAPRGGEFQVNSYTTGRQHDAEIAVMPSGDFVVVWTSWENGTGDGNVFGQRFTSTGSALGPEFRVNTLTVDVQYRPDVAADADGNFIVTWTNVVGDHYTRDTDVLGQRYSSSGAEHGQNFMVNTYTPGRLDQMAEVAMAPDGTFVVAWQGGPSGPAVGTEYDIFGQRFDSSGAKAGPEFQTNQSATTPWGPWWPSVGMNRSGDFLVAFEDNSEAIMARRYDPRGASAEGEFQVSGRTTGGQYYTHPQVSVVDGNAVIAWTSWASGYGVIHAQRYSVPTHIRATANQAVEGTGEVDVAVTLDWPVSGSVTVDYATGGGTATPDVDYAADSGTLSFAPGETQVLLPIVILDDGMDEPTETVDAAFSNPVGASLDASAAEASVLDDDPPSSLALASASATEGDTGTSSAVFTVTLTPVSAWDVTVHYATADGTAAAGSDYTATSGTLTFAPGEASQTISVPILGDTVDEAWETFTVTLSSPTHATLGWKTRAGTIVDDDAVPALSLTSGVTVTEADSGSTSAVFTAILALASGRVVTVQYATTDGSATAGVDYAASSGGLTFSPGQTALPISVPVLGDIADEGNETFTVALASPTSAVLGSGRIRLGTIVDDDPLSSLALVSSVTVTEGNTGSTDAVFTVSLTPASGRSVTVQYATSDGSATAPADYAPTAGTLGFAPGQTSRVLSVPILGDTLDEANETFTVTLSSPTASALGWKTRTGTITDDDDIPSLSISDVSIVEGASAGTTAVFSVTLSAPSGRTITVAYSSADLTAMAGSDYTTVAGNLAFTPGEANREISVSVLGDAVHEGVERFKVVLGARNHATVSDGTGVCTVTDDDP